MADINETSGFFNAEYDGETGEYDRVYTSDQFADYFSQFIGNGVFANIAAGLKVYQGDYTTPNMTVSVYPGKAFIKGYWYYVSSAINLSVSTATGTSARVDCICVRMDIDAREITVVYHENQQVPIRSGNIYELMLCTINVGATATQITDANIVDTRANNTYCGYVSGLIEQVDTTDLFNQMQAYLSEFEANEFQEFYDWFNEVKNILSDDDVGRILAYIDNINTNFAAQLTQKQNNVSFIEYTLGKGATGVAETYLQQVSALPTGIRITYKGSIVNLNGVFHLISYTMHYYYNSTTGTWIACSTLPKECTAGDAVWTADYDILGSEELYYMSIDGYAYRWNGPTDTWVEQRCFSPARITHRYAFTEDICTVTVNSASLYICPVANTTTQTVGNGIMVTGLTYGGDYFENYQGTYKPTGKKGITFLAYYTNSAYKEPRWDWVGYREASNLDWSEFTGEYCKIHVPGNKSPYWYSYTGSKDYQTNDIYIIGDNNRSTWPSFGTSSVLWNWTKIYKTTLTGGSLDILEQNPSGFAQRLSNYMSTTYPLTTYLRAEMSNIIDAYRLDSEDDGYLHPNFSCLFAAYITSADEAQYNVDTWSNYPTMFYQFAISDVALTTYSKQIFDTMFTNRIVKKDISKVSIYESDVRYFGGVSYIIDGLTISSSIKDVTVTGPNFLDFMYVTTYGAWTLDSTLNLYTQNVTVAGMTADRNYAVGLSSEADLDTRTAAKEASMAPIDQGTDYITIACDSGDYPTVDIPIIVQLY